jgi:hypothetical protein
MTLPRLGRREWLVGAGAAGAALALGHGRPARASDGRPVRFVFFLSGNGMDAATLMSSETKAWIAASRGEPVRDDLWWGEGYGAVRGYGASHRELATIEDELTTAPVLAGLGDLSSRAAVVMGLSELGITGGHSSFHGVLSSTRTVRSDPGGVTIDDFLAGLDCVRGTGARRTPVPAVRVGVSSSPSAVSFETCASGPGRALPLMLSHTAAWDAYVGPLAGGDTAQLDRRTRLLEFAFADATRAREEAPPGRAREQAAAYARSLEQLLENQSRFGEVILASGETALPARPAETLAPLDAMRAQLATVSAALRTGLTNVAVVGMGTGEGFHALRYGVGPRTAGERHALCHQYGDAAAADIRAELRLVWRAEVDAVLTLARALRDTPEIDGDGSMLDRTVIVYTTDNGVGHHARSDDQPVLLLGGEALGLRTGGRTLIYPEWTSESAERRQVSNLWNTLGTLAGEPLDDFGDPRSRLAPGPLPALVG